MQSASGVLSAYQVYFMEPDGALFAIPGLLKLIGSERFGLLVLAWGLSGNAGMLDLGVGRATTQRNFS